MTHRPSVRALGWVAAIAGTLVLVRLAGSGALAAPPTTSGQDMVDWVDRVGPATTAMSLVRLMTEGVLWYLLAVAAIHTVAIVTRSTASVRLADLVAAPLPDRLVRVALGMSLATAVQPGAIADGHLAAGPRSTGTATMVVLDRDDASGALPTMEQLSGRGDPREVATGGPIVVDPDTYDGDTARATPWPSTAEEPSNTSRPAPRSAATAAPESWTVSEGESFWLIASDAVTEQLGRPASDAEIVPFWEELIDANRHRLVDPDDPDLILPGQVLEMPT